MAQEVDGLTIDPVAEQDPPRQDPAGVWDELENREAGDALSAAALAYDAQHFSTGYVETDSVQRSDDAQWSVELNVQILYLDDVIDVIATATWLLLASGDIWHTYSLS
jgi:hypothetical protein